MINQPTTSDPSGGHSFVEGMEVFDVAGETVGRVIAQGAQAGCLVVQKGWLFAHELYVPFSYVVSQDGRGVSLNLSKDELKDDRWKVPPTNPEMAAAAANLPMVAGSQMGGVDPAAATPLPPMESPGQEPEQPVTPTPMNFSVKDYEQPLSVPPLESVVRDDGRPVGDRVDIEDEQPVDEVLAPDGPAAETDQSSQSDADLNAVAQPLQDEQPIDVDVVPDASAAETDQSSQSVTDLNAEAQPLQDEQPIDVDVIPDAPAAETDQSSQSDTDLNAEAQPLQTAGAGANWSKQSDELEQRVLDRMEGAAAGVAATQTSLHAAAPPEENRSGAALRAALLVGFDVALKQDAARLLSEPGPRGSADPIAALLAGVGPADISEQAPLLAAAWRAALAVAADNPSVAPEVRRALERLARD
jgi:hypothetical protein